MPRVEERSRRRFGLTFTSRRRARSMADVPGAMAPIEERAELSPEHHDDELLDVHREPKRCRDGSTADRDGAVRARTPLHNIYTCQTSTFQPEIFVIYYSRGIFEEKKETRLKI